MEFEKFLAEALGADAELKKEYDALQADYEVIDALISARVERGMTQKELAKLCGLPQSNISRLESGNANPTLKLLKKIANALDCDLELKFVKRDEVSQTVQTSTANEVQGIFAYITVPIMYKNFVDTSITSSCQEEKKETTYVYA